MQSKPNYFLKCSALTQIVRRAHRTRTILLEKALQANFWFTSRLPLRVVFAESVRESELYITSQGKKSDNVLHADGQGQHSNRDLWLAKEWKKKLCTQMVKVSYQIKICDWQWPIRTLKEFYWELPIFILLQGQGMSIHNLDCLSASQNCAQHHCPSNTTMLSADIA